MTVADAGDAASADLRKALVRLRRIEDAFDRTGQPFEDPDFPPPAANGDSASAAWVRPHEIGYHDGRWLDKHEDWELFRGRPCSEDIQQGSLGNCWLLGALSALAEHQEGRFVRALLPKQRRRCRAGAYVIRLCFGGQWHAILVDDRLPCYRRSASSGHDACWALEYCRTGRTQLWASIVEKGLAKLCGSYEAIIGGFACDAFSMITGWPCTGIRMDGSWPRDMWGFLLGLARRQLLVGCSSCHDVEEHGLHPSHVYTLVDVVEVPSAPEDTSVRLLKVRDPQKTSKWSGAWSDASERWTEELRAKLGCETESSSRTGVIFISFEDFLKMFLHIAVCEAREDDWCEQRLPLALRAEGLPAQALRVKASKTTECVASISVPYVHEEEQKYTLWLVLLRVEAWQSLVAPTVQLVARTRFTREFTVSIEFELSGGSEYIVLPFHSQPNGDGRNARGNVLEGMWACFSRQPLECEACQLAAGSCRELEAASVTAYQWHDRGMRGLVGDTPCWREPLVLDVERSR